MIPQLGRTLQHLRKSFNCAMQGIAWAARTGRNWKIEAVAAGFTAGAAVALRISSVEAAILTLTIALVLSLETMNSAVEATVDALGGPPSVMAGRAKDAAAGSVLIAAALSLAVAAAIFGPRLVSLF